MTGVEDAAREFVARHVERLRPLQRQANLASWEAAITGRDEAIRRSADARTAVRKLYAERDGFERVREFLASPELVDPMLRRQLVLVDHGFTANQLPAETIEDFARREAELEGIFYTFRARLDGARLSNNELRQRLREESDGERRKVIWESSKQVGVVIAPLLLELVRRRNEAARTLGFSDYYAMELSLQEIDEADLFTLVEDFRVRSDEPFRALRARLDSELAARFGVNPEDLRPWHWDDFFAQEAPAFGSVDLNPLFAGFDHAAFAEEYFASIGLPVDDVLARSDLYERDGKDQHAFCTDVDREGDVRILCNLRPDERWMGTLLHELGHAVYDKFIPRGLPYLLRTPAHTLSTESIAMYFGRLTRNPEWLRTRLPGHPEVEDSAIDEQQRLSMLVAARWMLVMIHFERALYRDPEGADLGELWWDLVERFQLIARPDGRDEPDWATKIHLSLAPVYYHNYLLGELMASQLTSAIRSRGDEAGDFLTDEIFARGATIPWNGLLVEATGGPLSATHFLDQFVTEPSVE